MSGKYHLGEGSNLQFQCLCVYTPVGKYCDINSENIRLRK